MKLGLLTAAFAELTAREVADWAAGNGFEALEIACWPRGGGERRRYAGVTPHRRRRARRGRRAGSATCSRATGSRSPRSPTTRTTCTRTTPHREEAQRAPAQGDRRGRSGSACRVVGTFVGNDKDAAADGEPRRFARVWPPLVALRRRARRQDRDRELPDDLLATTSGRAATTWPTSPRDLAARCSRRSRTRTSGSTSTRRTSSGR